MRNAHAQFTLEERAEAQMGREKICLNVSCLALKYEFCFITV